MTDRNLPAAWNIGDDADLLVRNKNRWVSRAPADVRGITTEIAIEGPTIGFFPKLNFIDGNNTQAQQSNTTSQINIAYNYVKSQNITAFEEDFLFGSAAGLASGNISTGGTLANMGKSNWNLQAGGHTGFFSVGTSANNRPGVFRIQTGTTSLDSCCLVQGTVGFMNPIQPSIIAEQINTFEWIMSPGAIGATLDWNCGFVDTYGTFTTPLNGIFFRYNPVTGKIEGIISTSASGSFNTVSNVTAVAGTFYRLSAVKIVGGFEFFVNGSSIGTVTSAFPTGVLLSFGTGIRTSSTTARFLDLDYCAYESVIMSR